MIKDFFGRESEAFFSRKVSAKSDLTAGYVDPKTPNILLIQIFFSIFFQDLCLKIIVRRDIIIVLAK